MIFKQDGCVFAPGRKPNSSLRSTSGFKLLTFNARSLCNKLHLFEAYVKDIDPDFITVTETWAYPALCDGVFSVVNYNLFRKDRIGRRGGGVLIYVRSTLSVIPCFSLNDSDQEALFCEIHFGKMSVIIGVVYRPPDSKDDSHLIELLKKNTCETWLLCFHHRRFQLSRYRLGAPSLS